MRTLSLLLVAAEIVDITFCLGWVLGIDIAPVEIAFILEFRGLETPSNWSKDRLRACVTNSSSEEIQYGGRGLLDFVGVGLNRCFAKDA